MKTISPKKYIETKARTLPIYKCMINTDWRQGKMASVIVMRKHVNGNITSGIYLVDLLCLGIKKTIFSFNENEDTVMERFAPMADVFETIDYPTAHNIIYAGHDFALEYDIKPHKDFSVTKYILEDDNDAVPLVEIEVGDMDGKPHLMVHEPGHYIDALAKLKKNAGEGNYNYTIAINPEEYDEDEHDDEDNDELSFSKFMDDYEEGMITPLEVQHIRSVDIRNAVKVKSRTLNEQLTIKTELLLRVLNHNSPEYFYNEEVDERPEFEYIDDAINSSFVEASLTKRYFNAVGEIANYFNPENADEDTLKQSEEFFISLLKKYADNPLVVSSIYENTFLDKNEKAHALAQSYLETLMPEYPLAALTLALCALFRDGLSDRFNHIYNETDAKHFLSQGREMMLAELSAFWLIQLIVHLRKGDLKSAIPYYELFAETQTFNWLLLEVQGELNTEIAKALKIGNEVPA